MNEQSLRAAYKTATTIAHSLADLKAVWPQRSFHPSADEHLQTIVTPILRATVELTRLLWEETEIFKLAFEQYSDVVRCGTFSGHSYLDLALRYGNVVFVAFVPLHGNCSELPSDFVLVVPDYAKDSLDIDWLNSIDCELGLCLDNELARIVHGSQKRADETPTLRVSVTGNVIVVDSTNYPVHPRFANMTRELLLAYGEGESVSSERFQALPACKSLKAGDAIETLKMLVPPFEVLIQCGKGRTGGWYFTCLEKR